MTSPLTNTYLPTIINPSPKLLLWCLVPSSIVCKAASILSAGKPSLENGKNQSTDEERIKMKVFSEYVLAGFWCSDSVASSSK